MNDTAAQAEPAKGRGLSILENILLLVCAGVIVLRTSIAEMPLLQSSDRLPYHNLAPYSLILSIILIGVFLLWLTVSILTNQFIYRNPYKSVMEIGLLLLIIASCIAGVSASNGRAAITNAIIFAAPVFMAIFLIQVLDSGLKIKLVLAAVAAAGFMNAYQSADQYFKGNQELIKQYKENPQKMLDTMGIEKGSIEHFQFEHRLFSKDITGYFTTSNSTGSFAILAVFAAAVFLIEKIKNRKNAGADPWHIITCSVVASAILATLLFTHSKGAITAFIIAVIFFAGALLFGKQLYAYRRKIAFIAVLLAAAALAAIFYYGLSHHKLPGGNSMLVRQQYWQSAVRIYENHPLTGIGGGNFANYYFHYKTPESLESVSDPHNFLLSILVQYGPLGLAGFLAIIIIPLCLIIFSRPASRSPDEGRPSLILQIHQTKLNKTFIAASLFAMLLLIRPLVEPLPKGILPEERIASLFILYLIPAAAFLVGFLLISAGGLFSRTAGTTLQNEAGEAAYPIEIVAALFCAAAGVLIHNVVDFAILEPPVLTAFCACFACLVSTDLNYRGQGAAIHKLQPAGKALPVAASIAVFTAVLYFGLIPVERSINKMAGATNLAVIGQFDQAHLLLESAAKDDPLSPLVPSVSGRFYTAEYLRTAMNAAKAGKPDNNTGLLFDKAEKSLLEAIRRDKASYKDYERLSNLYVLSAEQNSEPQKKAEWLNKAYKTAEETVALYPSSDRLRFYLAQIAGKLGKKDVALENYKKAVEFEDAFREQFRIMYPGWKSSSGEFSRLGQDKYDAAKKQIELLSK